LEEIGVPIVPSTVVDFVADENERLAAATDADVTEAKERYLSMCFLQSVNNNNYSPYLDQFFGWVGDFSDDASPGLQRATTSFDGYTHYQLEGGDGVAFTQNQSMYAVRVISPDFYADDGALCQRMQNPERAANTRIKFFSGWSEMSFVLSGSNIPAT
jgi:hypothetical protein